MISLDKGSAEKAFSQVFEVIKSSYPFKNKREFFEFEKVFFKYQKRLTSLDFEAEFYLFLKDFLANLKNSHTKLGNYSGRSFFQPNGHSVVFASEKYFLKKGSDILGRIISINGKKPEAVMKEKMKKVAASTKQYAFVQALKLFLGNMESGSIEVELRIGNKAKIIKLSQRPLKFKASNKILTAKIFGQVGYLEIESWTGEALSGDLEKKLEFFKKKKIKSLIIDVRENSGGNSELAKRFASHFFNKKVVFGVVLERKSRESFRLVKRKLYVEPTSPYYGWPICLLIGPACLSSNEYFIGGLKDNQRAVLFGMPTGGGSGNPKKSNIQIGDLNFELLVSSWIFYRANGKLLEGRGIRPDVVVNKTITDKKNDKDVVLEKVINFRVRSCI